MIHPAIQFDRAALQALCREYGIRELYVFGSATRGDFSPESDLDLLVEYESGSKPNFDVYFEMLERLEHIFGRKVDLVQGRESLVNPYRRYGILRTLERLYAA